VSTPEDTAGGDAVGFPKAGNNFPLLASQTPSETLLPKPKADTGIEPKKPK